MTDFDEIVTAQVRQAQQRLSRVDRYIEEGFYGLAAGACEGAANYFQNAAEAQEKSRSVTSPLRQEQER